MYTDMNLCDFKEGEEEFKTESVKYDCEGFLKTPQNKLLVFLQVETANCKSEEMFLLMLKKYPGVEDAYEDLPDADKEVHQFKTVKETGAVIFSCTKTHIMDPWGADIETEVVSTLTVGVQQVVFVP